MTELIGGNILTTHILEGIVDNTKEEKNPFTQANLHRFIKWVKTDRENPDLETVYNITLLLEEDVHAESISTLLNMLGYDVDDMMLQAIVKCHETDPAFQNDTINNVIAYLKNDEDEGCFDGQMVIDLEQMSQDNKENMYLVSRISMIIHYVVNSIDIDSIDDDTMEKLTSKLHESQVNEESADNSDEESESDEEDSDEEAISEEEYSSDEEEKPGSAEKGCDDSCGSS